MARSGVYFLLVLALVYYSAHALSVYSTPGTPIGPSVSTVTDTISVSQSGFLFDLNVQLDLGGHTFMGDIVATIQSPQGSIVTLIANDCGSDNWPEPAGIFFDDSATIDPYVSCSGVVNGASVMPTDALSTFIGETIQGTWTLTVNDVFNGDAGTLDLWGLIISSSTNNIAPLQEQICGGVDSVQYTYGGASTADIDITSGTDTDITITPNSFSSVSPGSTIYFNVICNEIGAIELLYFANGVMIDHQRSYCMGTMSFTGTVPSQVVRGNDFELMVQLTPPPVQVTQVIASEDNPLVIPGTDRMTFAIDQSIAGTLFYVPVGEVGPVGITFRSTSLFDYADENCNPLFTNVDILGTITTSLHLATIGDGVSVDVRVFLHPPAAGTVVVTIDEMGFGDATPRTLTFNDGEFVKTFSFYPVASTAPEAATMSFSAPYYDTLLENFTIIGSIFTDIPLQVSTFVDEALTVSILPGATGAGVTVTLTSSSNVDVPSSLFFANGVSLVHYTLSANAEGPAWVLFSAPGYISFQENFTVVDVDCDAGYTTGAAGDLCVRCPTNGGVVCSNFGDCTYSMYSDFLARCDCNDNWIGSSCQFTVDDPDCLYFTTDGAILSTSTIPGTDSASFNVPAGLIDDDNVIDGGNGTICVEGFPNFADAVSPWNGTPTQTGMDVTPLVPGFDMDISLYDNTPLDVFQHALTVTFWFDKYQVTQSNLEQAVLYIFNETSSVWQKADAYCPSGWKMTSVDIINLTYTQNLCATGQYHFFEVSPTAAHEQVVEEPDDAEEPYDYNDLNGMVVTGTTGQTGVDGGNLPPQPHFPPDTTVDPSPPKKSIVEVFPSSSSASSTVVSIFSVLALAVMLMF